MRTDYNNGKFGVGYIHKCNCKNESEICNKQTGECKQSGCAPGVKNTPGCLEGDNINF